MNTVIYLSSCPIFGRRTKSIGKYLYLCLFLGFSQPFDMADKLQFNPKALRKLQSPFTLLKRKELDGKYLIKFVKCNREKLQESFGRQFPEAYFKLLDQLAEGQLTQQTNKIKSNYKKLRLTKDEKEYIDKYLGAYYYKSFLKLRPILQEIPICHKVLTADRRYKNFPCTFHATFPRLSFKLIRTGKALSLETYYQIKDREPVKSNRLKRFRFLVQDQHDFYCLKKTDWQLLEDLYWVDDFSDQEFREKYQQRLKKYPLDTSEAFEEEVREIEPDTLIQVSELNGNLLLFIPQWSYDGVVVEGDKTEFEIYEDGKRVVYKRNKAAENKTRQFLENAHPSFKGKNSFFLTFEEASKKDWFFNFYHHQLKDNFEVVGMDMLSYFRYSDYQIETTFQIVKTLGNKVEARFETYFGKEKVPVKVLQKALNEGKKFVLLKDNSLGVLTEEWIAAYAFMLQDAKAEGDKISFAKWVLLTAEKSAEQQKNLDIVLPQGWMEKWKQWNQSEAVLYEKPTGIKAQLRNYQQKGYEWMNLMAEVNAGTLLADDMGLGKTLQTITAMAYWLAQEPYSRFLVICPASLIYNWKNEFKKFAPEIGVAIYHGTKRDFSDFYESADRVLITSYALIRNDFEALGNRVWDGIVLDESHKIKNYQAQQTRAVLRLQGKRRIILNGTPIMNQVSDLYPQFKFLLPQLFSSPKRFQERFEKPIKNKKGTPEKIILKKLTDPFILRRTKETAAPDLPQKTESIMWCDMDTEQRQAYERIKSQVKENVFVNIKNKGLNKAKLGVLQGITKLRQVCSSPRLLGEEDDFKAMPSVKINSLIDELTSNLKNQKVVVFSQFLGTMDLLAREFEKQEIEYRSFRGSTPADKRIERVEEFQAEDSNIQVFLVSLMAGNTGINLSRANYVFLVEPWWNKAVQQQAIDRIHRIGQQQKVFAYNMICKHSIEEKIVQLQDKKQMLSAEVISDDSGFVKNLTEEDIAFLFE